MNIRYNTLKAEIMYENDDVTIISWRCNIGFGQLVIDTKTDNIIDDEHMGKEFCDKVIEIVKE